MNTEEGGSLQDEPRLYQWLRTSAEAGPLDKALVYDGNYLSWRGLLHVVDRRADEFERFGLGALDWVGLMLGNTPDFVVLTLALSKIGATVVSIDPKTEPSAVDPMLQALIAYPEVARRAYAAVPTRTERLKGTILTCTVCDHRREPPRDRFPLVLCGAPAEGRAPAVGRTTQALETVARAVVEHHRIDGASSILTVLPFASEGAWQLGLLPALRAGAEFTLVDDASSPADIAEEYLAYSGLTLLSAAPAFYAELCKLADEDLRGLVTIGLEDTRLVCLGPYDPELDIRFTETFGNQLLPWDVELLTA